MCLFTFLPPLELPVNDLFGSFLQSTPGLPIEESHKSENPQFFSKFPSTLERRPSVSFEDFTVIQTHTNHFSFRWVILRGSGVMTVLLLFWWHSFSKLEIWVICPLWLIFNCSEIIFFGCMVGNSFPNHPLCQLQWCYKGQVSSVILTTLNSCYVQVINSVRRRRES